MCCDERLEEDLGEEKGHDGALYFYRKRFSLDMHSVWVVSHGAFVVLSEDKH